MFMDPYYEIVVYNVGDTADADRERRLAMERVKMLPGFLSWTPFTGVNSKGQRTDLVAWATLNDALVAAQFVGSAPEYADFRMTVSSVATMGHYTAPSTVTSVPADANGIEIAQFRLKAGVDEEGMRAAYGAMVAGHLAHQPGWQGHQLVRLKDGVFVDVTYADTEKRAVEICEGWLGNPDCERFLSMIEMVSMDFGTAATDMTAV